MEIRPLEVPVRMSYAKLSDCKGLNDFAKPLETEELPNSERYDEMMRDFYSYILGYKQNPFTYEHEYALQEVLDEIIGGVKSNGTNIN